MNVRRKQITVDINSIVPYYVRGWVSGIGRTTMELVRAMNGLSNLPIDITLYSQNMKGIGGRNLGLDFRNKHLYLPYRRNWNKVVSFTPMRELLTGYDLYHIPHNFDYVHNPDRAIVTIHDTLFFTHPEQSLNHAYSREQVPELAKKCRGIITCSESSKRDIVKYMNVPEDKVDVCPWGLNHQMFYPNKQKRTGAPFFLMVSCSTGRKNTISLIRAYEKFVTHNPRHELVLVWPNPSKEIQEYCDKEPLRSHVYICNDIDDERLSRLYNEATATFFPSRYEGFGLPVLESLACGTPVVTCNNSALPEVGGDAAFYVDPDDIDSMVDYMERFENNEFDMATLSAKCIQQAQQFRWERCARQTIEVYQKYL